MSNQEQSVEKLVLYQQELQLEEEWLRKMIAKLNAQAHALQVEQLHILNAMNRKPRENTQFEQQNNVKVDLKRETAEVQELDLTVPNYQSCEEDEDDEMED